MGASVNIPTPEKPPTVDTFGARLRALQYAESQKRLKNTRGRAAAFLFPDQDPNLGIMNRSSARNPTLGP